MGGQQRILTERTLPCPRCGGAGTIPMTFGALVKQRRNELGMTQEQLSDAVGVTRPQIANIESGQHDAPLSKLKFFSKALECSIEELLP